jgi:hypothetical protein
MSLLEFTWHESKWLAVDGGGGGQPHMIGHQDPSISLLEFTWHDS